MVYGHTGAPKLYKKKNTKDEKWTKNTKEKMKNTKWKISTFDYYTPLYRLLLYYTIIPIYFILQSKHPSNSRIVYKIHHEQTTGFWRHCQYTSALRCNLATSHQNHFIKYKLTESTLFDLTQSPELEVYVQI